MPSVSRIKKGWEFDLIFRTGIHVNGDLVRLLYVKDNDNPEIKSGFAVGKRQGKAHIRSRGRRILREAFRQLSHRLKPGIKLVLGLKDKGLDAKTQDIQRELELLFMRKNLFKSCSPEQQ